MDDEIPISRPTFDRAFYALAEPLAKQALEQIPELEAVVVIPSWHVEQSHVPSAILKGRHGPPATPTELMHILKQLHLTYDHVLQRLLSVLQAADQHAGDLAQRIETARAELTALGQGPEA